MNLDTYMQVSSLSDKMDFPRSRGSLQRVTDLLLRIETLEDSKGKLMQKLASKETKWIENDKLFKERRVTLMAVLQLDLTLLNDINKNWAYLQTLINKRICSHEKVLVMLNQVLTDNR